MKIFNKQNILSESGSPLWGSLLFERCRLGAPTMIELKNMEILFTKLVAAIIE